MILRRVCCLKSPFLKSPHHKYNYIYFYLRFPSLVVANTEQPFNVMIIATFRDEIKREDHGKLAAKLATSYSSVEKEFGDKLHFRGRFAINATVNDADFDRLRVKLSEVCRDILSVSKTVTRFQLQLVEKLGDSKGIRKDKV